MLFSVPISYTRDLLLDEQQQQQQYALLSQPRHRPHMGSGAGGFVSHPYHRLIFRKCDTFQHTAIVVSVIALTLRREGRDMIHYMGHFWSL
jgi:hypothetical protein